MLARALSPRPLVDLLGAAVAGAGLDRDRGRACSSRCPGSGCGSGCRRSAGRSALFVFFVLAVAATVPLFFVRWPSAIDGLAAARPHQPAAAPAGHRHRRPDGARGRRSSSRPRSGAPMWSARLRAARALKAGKPSPRLAAPRSVCAARAGAGARGRDLLRRRQRAHQARRRGVRLARRGHAGQLPHRRLGDAADLHRPAAADPAGPAPRRAVAGAQRRGRCRCRPARRWWCARPARPSLDVAVAGGIAEAKPATAAPQAPKGTEERRYTITDAGTATVRGVRRGRDLDASPPSRTARRPSRSPRSRRRSCAARCCSHYKIEDDYGVVDAQATFERKAAAAARRRQASRGRCTARRISRWCCRRRAPATAPARPPRT